MLPMLPTSLLVRILILADLCDVLNQARAHMVFVFPHPREQTFYLKLESSLYTNNKGYIALMHR